MGLIFLIYNNANKQEKTPQIGNLLDFLTLSEPGMTLRFENTCKPDTFLPCSGIMWSTWCSMPDALDSMAASWYFATMRCALGSQVGVRWSLQALYLLNLAFILGRFLLAQMFADFLYCLWFSTRCLSMLLYFNFFLSSKDSCFTQDSQKYPVLLDGPFSAWYPVNMRPSSLMSPNLKGCWVIGFNRFIFVL